MCQTYDTTTVTYSTRPYTNGSLSGTCQGSGTVFVPVGHYDLGQMKARLAGTAPKDSAPNSFIRNSFPWHPDLQYACSTPLVRIDIKYALKLFVITNTRCLFKCD